MDEIEKIKLRYEERKANPLVKRAAGFSIFNAHIKKERESKYLEIIQKEFKDISVLKVIEVGAGGGDNLNFFHSTGIPFKQIWANELLEDRGEVLKQTFPLSNVLIGDALKLNFKEEFDIVFQSTVFTSVLDRTFKKALAQKMMDMVKQDGIIVWYDFIYNNPNNADVKGVSKNEVKELFKGAKSIDFYKVTLAPPIGRRVGNMYALINNLFPFLRTHIIAVIKK